MPVYGLGTYGDGRPFYAMKFIKGDSLKAALERFHEGGRDGATPGYDSREFRQLLQRFIDVCQAMQYAHDRGVLHRDLKPGNIMLGRYGETLVVDWGLAKPLGEAGIETAAPDAVAERPLIPRSSGGSSGSETLPGQAIGTPAYMSPEQAAGRLSDLGPPTDVYSLGATLYHILTSRPPFERDRTGKRLGVPEILALVKDGELIPPHDVRPGIPRPLDAICRKAMSKAPEDRYATPRQLAEDVEHWLADEPIAARADRLLERTARFGRKHRGVVTTVLAASLLAAAGATAAALLINAQKNETARIAAEKSDLAEEKGALADRNGKLAESEQQARRQAEDAEKSALESSLAGLRQTSDSLLTSARLIREIDVSDSPQKALDAIRQGASLRPQAEAVLDRLKASDERRADDAAYWDRQAIALRNEATRWMGEARLKLSAVLDVSIESPGRLAVSPGGNLVAWKDGPKEVLVADAQGAVLHRLDVSETFSLFADKIVLTFQDDTTLELANGPLKCVWTLPNTKPEVRANSTDPARTVTPAGSPEKLTHATASNARYRAEFTLTNFNQLSIAIGSAEAGSPLRTVWKGKRDYDEGGDRMFFGRRERELYYVSRSRIVLIDAATGSFVESPLAQWSNRLVSGRSGIDPDRLTLTRGGFVAPTISAGLLDGKYKVAFWSAFLPEHPVSVTLPIAPGWCLAQGDDGLDVVGGADFTVEARRGAASVWRAGTSHGDADLPAYRAIGIGRTWQFPWGGFVGKEPPRLVVERRVSRVASETPPVSLPTSIQIVGPFYDTTAIATEVYSPEDGRLLKTYPAHGDGRLLAVAPDRSVGVVVAKESPSFRTLEVWSVATPSRLGELGDVPHAANLSLSPKARWLLAEDPAAGQLKIWSLPDVRLVATLSLPPGGHEVAFDPIHDRALLRPSRNHNDPSARLNHLIDLEAGAKTCEMTRLESGRTPAEPIEFTRSVRYAVQIRDGIASARRVAFFDLKDGKPLPAPQSVWWGDPAISFDLAETRCLILGRSPSEGHHARAELWDLSQGTLLRAIDWKDSTEARPEIHSTDAKQVAFAPWRSTTSRNGTDRESTRLCWKWADGSDARPSERLTTPIFQARTPVEWSPTGHLAVSNVDSGYELHRTPQGIQFTRLGEAELRPVVLADTAGFDAVSVQGGFGVAGSLFHMRFVGIPTRGSAAAQSYASIESFWDPSDGKQLLQFPTHHVLQAISEDRRWGVTISYGSAEATLWDLTTFEPARRFSLREFSAEQLRPFGAAVIQATLQIQPGGHSVAIGGNGRLVVTDPVENAVRLHLRPTGHGEPVTLVAQDAGLQRAASADASGRVFLWNRDDGRLIRSIDMATEVTKGGKPKRLVDMMFLTTSARLVTSTDTGALAAYTPDGEPAWTAISPTPRSDYVTIAAHPSGTILVAAATQGELDFLDARTGNVLGTIPGDGSRVHCLSFSDDGAMLAVAGTDGWIRIWRAEDAAPRFEWLRKPPPLALRFTSGKEYLLAAGETTEVLDVATGRSIWAIPMIRGAIRGLAVHRRSGAWTVFREADTTLKIDLVAAQRDLESWHLDVPGISFVRPDGEVPDGSAWHPFLQRQSQVAESRWKENLDAAEEHMRGGRWRDAVDRCGAAILLRPRNAEAWRRRGIAWLRLDDRRSSMGDLSQAIDLGDDGPEVRLERARLYAQSQLWSHALKDLDDVVTKKPGHVPALVARAEAYTRLQNFAAAESDCDAVLQQEPGNLAVRKLRTTLFLYGQRWEEAVREADEALMKDPTDATLWYTRGAAQQGLSRLDLAAVDFRKALELKPDDPLSRTWLGHLEANRGNMKEAIEAFDRAMLSGAAAPAQVFFYRAVAALDAVDLGTYMSTCQSLLRYHEPLYNVDNLIAWSCSLTDQAPVDRGRIVNAGRRAAVRPSHPTLNTLGAALYRSGQYAECRKTLTEAIALHGKGGSVEDWVFLAMASYRLDQVDEAFEWLEKIKSEEETDPKFARTAWPDRSIRQMLVKEARALVRRKNP